jgi:cystathionine gamma-synthase
MERFYDAVTTMKGPSFGADRTILCPFMYLAHYDLVTSEAGRSQLQAAGIDPDLIRIAVGTEPYEELEAVFAAALEVSL